MAIGINLALRFAAFFSLSLFAVLAFFVAMTGVADVTGVAVRFFHGLNFLFDAAAAPAPTDLFDFLLKMLLLIFFFASQSIALHQRVF